MRTAEPWEESSRDRLPAGWTYPLTRDELRRALDFRQARLEYLDFSWAGQKAAGPLYLLVLHWSSDAEARYFRIPDPERMPLRMSHHAVPESLARQIADELRTCWLDRAVTWAKAAPGRGNAWTASDHSWVLTYTAKDGIRFKES